MKALADHERITARYIEDFSHASNEPGWMTARRLDAWAAYERSEMPALCRKILGGKNNLIRMQPGQPVPEEKSSICAFGQCDTPADQCPAAGILMHQDSNTGYARLQKEWVDRGVIFTDMATAIREYPDLVQRYLGTVISHDETIFTALAAAAWRVGSFIFVPAGVELEMPLHAYYRIASHGFGQFERTLIVAEQKSSVCYLEGCGSSAQMREAVHVGMVEVVAQEQAKVRFITMQNWADSVVSCATKRAVAHEQAQIMWVDGTFGGKATFKYPTIMLKGAGASGHILASTVAMQGQHHDTGGTIYCQAPRTRALIDARSLGMYEGELVTRTKVVVDHGAVQAHARVNCDSLLGHEKVTLETYPRLDVHEPTAHVGHEARVATFEDEQLFFCQSRGITPENAHTLMALGFLDSFMQELPAEYAVEVARMVLPAMKGVHTV